MSNQGFKRIVNMFAFIGLCLIATALLLAQILSWVGVQATVVGAIRTVGECIAYIVTAIYAFFYVKNKRNVWWWVSYAVALVAVLLLFIFTI